MKLRRVSASVAATAALLIGLSACSKTVDKVDIQNQISDKLGEMIGHKPEKVNCPKDLDAREGAKYTCTLTDSGHDFPVDVTITKVDGKRVEFNIEAKTLKTATKEDLEALVIKTAEQDHDVTLESVTCPGNILVEVGTKVQCSGSTADGHGKIDVTVKTVTDDSYTITVEPVK